MLEKARQSGIASGRLSSDKIVENFSDLHPALTSHEAAVEADRCYFCYDAPCVNACPTQIDIPLFIRQISTGNVSGSAKTIFDQNILGGMCARVCPTETLCEQKCVRETAEGKPVKIGLLQRFATDHLMAEKDHPYERAEASGKKIAVVGAGPAGLACAHRLALLGHDVVIHDAAQKSGGLNEFGIAAYKTVNDFAQEEINFVTAIGGITVRQNCKLGENLALEELTQSHDAIFLGIGLGDVNALGTEQLAGVEDAVDFIAGLRQAKDLTNVRVGRRVVVIGGGMTAIDAAVQSKLLGSEEVILCYRRGKENMSASEYEQDLATSKGVVIRHFLQPTAIEPSSTGLAVHFDVTGSNGESETLETDQVLVAIGQKLDADWLSGSGIAVSNGKIQVDATGKTSADNIWAGGDCCDGGEDLTVTAVAQGRDAAMAIHAALSS